MNQDITSGAGRRLVCRSASALRRRSTNDIGSRSVRRSSSRRLRPAADSSPRAASGSPATSRSTAARSSRERHAVPFMSSVTVHRGSSPSRQAARGCGISPRPTWRAGGTGRRGATTHVGRARPAPRHRDPAARPGPSSQPPGRASRHRSPRQPQPCSASMCTSARSRARKHVDPLLVGQVAVAASDPLPDRPDVLDRGPLGRARRNRADRGCRPVELIVRHTLEATTDSLEPRRQRDSPHD